MRLLLTIPFMASMPALSWAASLPSCSQDSSTPCRCPAGTEYAESVTVSVIGAPAKDVGAIVNNFFDMSWFGVTPYATSGPENTPGKSTRSATGMTDVGTYNFTELLDELRIEPDGSFEQRFEQLPSSVPVEYDSGNGSFSGAWVHLEGTAIYQNETRMTWGVHVCQTGHPQGTLTMSCRLFR
ncbi:hypothetical protein F4780DRAFT_783609 [Xylariomycetidae sp. FL0641]|nr:hypothetical protein F4780DRAFT_783609 [Xylariomycetidae sp. FL0641]